MTESTRAISPLRQRMIDDMTLRKLGPRTQTAYIRAVKNFTRFFGQSPDAATAEDLRRTSRNHVESDSQRQPPPQSQPNPHRARPQPPQPPRAKPRQGMGV